MKRLWFSLLIFPVLILLSFTKDKPGETLKNGDLIFIVNPAGQGKAIQLATGSNYTHIGIVLFENGKPMVYHAVEPVSRNTVEEFKAMSADGKFEIKRLKDQSLLQKEIIDKMLAQARASVGKHYDIVFSWNDEELYCSEFVWKLYKNAVNVNIGEPRPLKEFDLSHPIVKSKLTERYGNKIPLNENMISPGDMFNSDLLQ